MTWKDFAADYLNFTRKDRIGILVIVILIAGIFFLPKAITVTSSSKPITNDTAWVAAMQRLEQKDTQSSSSQSFAEYSDDNSNNYQYDRRSNDYYNKNKGELFYFDPNTLSAEGWSRLGIRDKTIHTIQNYLNKGGQFRKPEDLQKVYGLFPNEYERIAPYIKIESVDATNNYKEYADNKPSETTAPKTFASRYSIVEINSADTTALIALPGIGSKLAARIIAFRNKLGGFYSVSQVGETFGLPDSTFQKIKQYLKSDNNAVKKININTATLDELKMHPYIRWGVANPVVAYRNEHGPFTKVEDIKKVMAVTDEVYNKIAPYLTL